MNVEEGYDFDDFDMDIDCDSDVESTKERKRALRGLRKESKNKSGEFYVGQEFVDKQQAISLVRSLAVASKRQFPNRGKLKQVNGKWIKCQKVQTSCSGHGINNVGVKQIKIEDIVKPNPEIPVKALKEQLQKKYQVGISIGKVKRARVASIMRAKGDTMS
ncbi:hypothetical protein Tco_0250627 [Tanacetum coccineum]